MENLENRKISFLKGLKEELQEEGLESPSFESHTLEVSSLDIIRLNNEINARISSDEISEHKSLVLSDRYPCKK